MLPIGIITNSLAIAAGGLLGASFSKTVPERISKNLIFGFGLASITLGISLIINLTSLPAVILAFLLGTAIGEWIDLEKWLESQTRKLESRVSRLSGRERPSENIHKLVSIIVLFCTGSTGLLGAMTEAMSGDPTILFTKAILDLFTAAIFAISLGFAVSALCIPQMLIFLLIFFVTRLFVPAVNPLILGDFMACGGIISMAIGLRLCEIRHVRITNMTPALLLVMPISWGWTQLFSRI